MYDIDINAYILLYYIVIIIRKEYSTIFFYYYYCLRMLNIKFHTLSTIKNSKRVAGIRVRYNFLKSPHTLKFRHKQINIF